MRKLTLPSKRELQIRLAPFEESKELWEAFLESLKGVKVTNMDEVISLLKDSVCHLGTSQIFKEKLFVCIENCTIDDDRISDKSFEAREHRKDYLLVLMEVAKENIFPFIEDLSADYGVILELLKKEVLPK